MIILTCIIVACAFFVQSLLGFGGGLLCIPILSLYMPVQDAILMVMVYQICTGFLMIKTYKETAWVHLIYMLPAMILGVIIGVALLNVVHSDIMRGMLSLYIILHLARSHTSFDPLGSIIKRGGAHFAGGIGGILNGMIGGGGPAFILYFKEKVTEPIAFRATIIATLMISNIPRAFGAITTGMLPWDLFLHSLYALPGFFFALYMGQKLHNKVQQQRFFIYVDCILVLSAILLIFKIVIH